MNAYFNGATDITLYDINIYAKYFVYLKTAAILCLDYIEFQEFFFKYGLKDYYNDKMFSINTFNKIKPTLKLLDYKSFLFFDKLFYLYDPSRIRACLFDDDENRNIVIKSFNIYLRNQITYNKLKCIIKNINFKYINGDIFNDDINGKFDNIFLSNLCTTTNINNLKNLLKKLNDNNLKQNGSILFGYLWDTTFNENYYKEDWLEIYKIPITKQKLSEYITEYYSIKGSKDFLYNNNNSNDLVLIYRKK